MANAQQDQLSATSLREMKSEDRTKLLAEKQAELLEKKRSLAANELANPRSITKLRREVALLKTIEHEAQLKQPEITKSGEETT